MLNYDSSSIRITETMHNGVRNDTNFNISFLDPNQSFVSPLIHSKDNIIGNNNIISSPLNKKDNEHNI